MYEITFIETGATAEVTYDEAIELLGEDDLDLALEGHLPHIVVVDISVYEDDGQPDELTEWLDFDPDC